MNQKDLIKALDIADSTFRKWRSALGISAKETYAEDEIFALKELKRLTACDGLKFDTAVAQILGEEKTDNSPDSYTDILVKRYGSKLQSEAKTIAKGMAIAFDEMVWSEFFNVLGSTKPTSFEKFAKTLTLTSEPIDVELLPMGNDENNH